MAPESAETTTPNGNMFLETNSHSSGIPFGFVFGLEGESEDDPVEDDEFRLNEVQEDITLDSDNGTRICETRKIDCRWYEPCRRIRRMESIALAPT